MPGRGPAPKDPKRRARTNAEPIAVRVIQAVVKDQPALPTIYVTTDEGDRKRFNWPTITREWWAMWAESPLSIGFTATDWSELRDTALIHARFWSGEVKLAAELRLRTAKFGATPEDRARLRIQFAQADEVETRNADRRSGSRDRFGRLAVEADVA